MKMEKSQNENPFVSIAKLLRGFCDPSSSVRDTSDAETTSESHNKLEGQSSRDLFQPLVESRELSASIMKEESPSKHSKTKHVEFSTAIPYAQYESNLELKATYNGRRNRVVRGLAVAGVGLLSLVITLYMLIRLGDGSAAIRFGKAGGSLDATSFISKPWIHIQYNKHHDKNSGFVIAPSTSDGADFVLLDRPKALDFAELEMENDSNVPEKNKFFERLGNESLADLSAS